MNHLLLYDNFLNEYYDTFSSKIKDWDKSRTLSHNVATKKGYFQNIFKNITPEDKNLIEWYRDGGYRQIAEFLFDNNFSDKAEYPNGSIKSLKECIIKLDNILEKTKIKKDVVLWKGLKSNSYTNKISLIEIINEMNVGDTYTFKNFFSTSINFQYALFSFAFQNSFEKHIMKINTPAGTKGTYISHDKIENEVLLQRNQTVKFIKSYNLGLSKYLRRRYVPESEKIIKIHEFDIV